MRTISVTAGDVSLTAELADNETANSIYDALPITGSANVWGDEIYFGIPVDVELASDATDLMDVGSLAYWPPGHAFCIFFGPTPASRGDEPRMASPGNIFGQINGNATDFRQVSDGTTVVIDKV